MIIQIATLLCNSRIFASGSAGFWHHVIWVWDNLAHIAQKRGIMNKKLYDLMDWEAIEGIAEPYTFIAKYNGSAKIELEDPYLYTDIIGESDAKRFESGTYYDIYNCFGAHPVAIDGCLDNADVRWDVTEDTDKNKKKTTVYGVHFAVWAPNAVRVSVTGDFNFWDGRRHQMCRVGNSGIF